MSYEETLEFLFKQLPMYQRDGKTAYKKDLTNILALCEALGNPEKELRFIHVAGTNGKGSTSHFLASILQESGYKTGLYTSPHLKDFRERIKINGELIEKEQVVQFVNKNSDKFLPIKPSFFEWSFALALYYFKISKIDIAVIETGLGGRLDSTNIIQPELSVITNVGMDHTDMLGNTLTEIAREKAGIIKSGIPVVIGNESGQKKLFLQVAHLNEAPISFAKDIELNAKWKAGLNGNYQQENIRTVLQTINVLNSKDWKISNQSIKNGLQSVIRNTGIRGRWELLAENPKTIVDVGHNYAAFEWIISQIKEEKFEQLHLILGFSKEKELEEIFKLLPKTALYYFCETDSPRLLKAIDLEKQAKERGLIGSSYTSPKAALNAAKKRASKSDFIFIGGSNFIASEIL